MANEYKKYNLLLDPNDAEEADLIDFLTNKKGNKHKNSYSAILKDALKLLKNETESLETVNSKEKLMDRVIKGDDL